MKLKSRLKLPEKFSESGTPRFTSYVNKRAYLRLSKPDTVLAADSSFKVRFIYLTRNVYVLVLPFGSKR